jgi:uridine phosphorylase
MHSQIGYPYIAGASASLNKHFVKDFYQGITVTCPGFMARKEEYYVWA